MKYYEIKVTLLLKKDIRLENINEFISFNINKSMLGNIDLKERHSLKGFKPYCIGSMYPFDLENKIYKANQIYILTVRSIDKDFLNKLKNVLKHSKLLDFNVLACQFLNKTYSFIESAFTLTPCIISITNEESKKTKYWTKDDSSLDFVKNRIKANLEKKYFQFYNERITAPDDFILMIEIKNRIPIVYNYKKSKLFSNKFKITFNSDDISQKLAFLAFGVGILEKNSLGFGFLTKGKE